jgi:RNA polymerase sigma-70 factor (ECF subfamily)
MSALNEQELVKAVVDGDQDALSELLDAYQHRVYNLCLRMLGNRDDAAEVAQDAMLKIIEHIGDFKGQSRVGTWIVRIAMNLAISHLRKRRLRQTVSIDAPDNGQTDSPLQMQLSDRREPAPGSNVEKKELIDHLQEALGQLEEQFRGVLVLRDIEQMDYQQIAEVLDIPVGTVKSRLFRARLALRKRLHKLFPSSPFDATAG